MRIFKNLFNRLFGNKQAEREIKEREMQLRFEHEMKMKEMQMQHEREMALLKAKAVKTEPKKPVVDKAKEEALLKRLRTYEAPTYVKKTQITKQVRERHTVNTKTVGKNPVTDKQETFIKVIEITVNKYYGYEKIHFTGSTKQDAMCWIDKHVREFRQIENSCVARAAR